LATLDAVVSRLLNRRQKILRYAFIPRGILGVSLALFGAYSGRAQAQILFAGARTTGMIVGHETHDIRTSHRAGRPPYRSSFGNVSFMPIVEFEADGKPIRFTSWWGRRSAPQEGERVSVLYDPANPSAAMIDLGFRNWIPWAPLFAVGVLLIVSALKGWLAFMRS
jgi:hypothetical protein